MGEGTTHYCWRCYATNNEPAGRCRSCGGPIAQPATATWTDQLIWALGHPLPGRQMIAAQILGRRREIRAAEPLRELVDKADPYLAAQALQSLVLIVGVPAIRDLLDRLARTGSPAVCRVAQRALERG
ncbi:MAG: HEAT repeat domain-containing protein [Solirubrobacteraceae bacterium]